LLTQKIIGQAFKVLRESLLCRILAYGKEINSVQIEVKMRNKCVFHFANNTSIDLVYWFFFKFCYIFWLSISAIIRYEYWFTKTV